MRFVHWIL